MQWIQKQIEKFKFNWNVTSCKIFFYKFVSPFFGLICSFRMLNIFSFIQLLKALWQGLPYSGDFTAKVLNKFCNQYGSTNKIMIIPTYSNDSKHSIPFHRSKFEGSPKKKICDNISYHPTLWRPCKYFAFEKVFWGLFTGIIYDLASNFFYKEHWSEYKFLSFNYFYYVFP